MSINGVERLKMYLKYGRFDKNAFKSVLVIEDDHESNQNLVFFLKNSFKKVISAYDGLEGWALYNQELPELIITDIEMPKMDGLTLVKKIRQYDSDTPIVLLSAYTHTDYLKQAIPLNLLDYIVKPLTFQKLTDVLKKVEQKRFEKHQKIIIDQLHNIEYDWDAKIVYINNQRYHLTHKEIQMLELLISAQGHFVGYDEIREIMYPDSLDSRNAIKCIIRDLRKKIPLISIESLPKYGYKLL